MVRPPGLYGWRHVDRGRRSNLLEVTQGQQEQRKPPASAGPWLPQSTKLASTRGFHREVRPLQMQVSEEAGAIQGFLGEMV